MAEEGSKSKPVALIPPPPAPLLEIFTPEVLQVWRNVQKPDDRLRYRLQVIEADGTYPANLRARRAQKAAWEAYLTAAFACGMFSGDKAADLRARLTGLDEDGFRSGMSECLACWFFAGLMRLPINPSAPGRGEKNLEMAVFDGDLGIGIEVKAPYRQHGGSGWGDDSDAVEGVLEQAEKQFDKERPNLLVMVPSGEFQRCSNRRTLMKALYGQSKVTFLFDKRTGAAVNKPKAQFFPDGKFFNNKRPGGKFLKPKNGMPAYQRVSALVCITETFSESDSEAFLLYPRTEKERQEEQSRIANNRVWVEHTVVVLHNPFAYHPIRHGLFERFPQCLPESDAMRWTDGSSTVV